MFRLNLPLYETPNPDGAGGPVSGEDLVEALGKDEPLELNLDDDDPGDSEEEVKEPKKDGEKETVEEELEEEIKEPEELDLINPARRRDILAKYPNLFKDFPQLEVSYYRERKYTEILPTIEDAQSAVDKSNLLDTYGEQVSQGDLTQILRDTKEQDEKVFYKVVDKYLESIDKVDHQAYLHVVSGIAKSVILHMRNTAHESRDQKLLDVAKEVHKFLFNTDKWEPHRNLSSEEGKDEKQEELERERELFKQEKFNSIMEDLDTRVTNILKGTIDKAVDPKNTLDGYIKKNISKDIFEKVQDAIERDERFPNLFKKYMEKAEREGYSQASLDDIKRAYLSKAKSLLPDIIRNVKREALGRSQKSPDRERDKRGPLPVGQTRRATSQPSGGQKAKIPVGMSTLEYLNKD